MKTMKQLGRIGKLMIKYVFAIQVFLLCAGCGGNKQNTLAGKWHSVTNDISYYMFLDGDGTGGMNVDGISFILKYETEQDRIIFEVDGDFYLSKYSFSSNGKNLTIKNLFGAGRDITFTLTS
jgi:hypothetical protein